MFQWKIRLVCVFEFLMSSTEIFCNRAYIIRIKTDIDALLCSGNASSALDGKLKILNSTK